MDAGAAGGEGAVDGGDDDIGRAMARWEELGRGADAAVMSVALRLDAVHAGARVDIERVHKAFGLAPGDFDVLATLARSTTGHVTPTYLARQLLYSKSGVTGRLDRLEARGLVVRSPNRADRRGLSVGLTPAGQEFMERVMPRHVAVERTWLEVLSDEELQTLDRLLAKVMRHAPR